MERDIVPGDLHELLVSVLRVDGGQLGVGSADQDDGQLLDDSEWVIKSRLNKHTLHPRKIGES